MAAPEQNGMHLSDSRRVDGSSSSSGSKGAGRSLLRRAQALGIAMVMLLALLLPGQPAEASGGVAGSRLQEVPPPAAVRQLQQALMERSPQLQILEPADESLLPEGPWTLKLRVEDWPLVDAGPLGLGPHLVVQLDEQPPLRLTTLETTMPPLAPGSHRLTVFAARPWGEAVKDPGAVRQIRLHHLAANPISLPARGTPQLIAVRPSSPASEEPLLLDWLLIDAPLQNLRSGDAGWRLRVTINGDSFLVDRQTPLWLRGWRPGLNPLQLELLDGRGEPLNPPFNSLVGGLRLDRTAPPPAWLAGALPAGTLARLLGELPQASASEPVAPQEQPITPAAPAAPGADEAKPAVVEGPGPAQPGADQQGQAQPGEAQPEENQAAAGRDGAETDGSELASSEREEAWPAKAAPLTDGAQPASKPPEDPLGASAEAELAEGNHVEADHGEANHAGANHPAGQETAAETPVPLKALPAAREQVNPDGTLIQPKRPSLLSGLRSRFGP